MKTQYIDSDEIQELLTPILERIRTSAFVEDYQSKASNSELMGMLISKYFKWNGVEILEASAYALEDANFHKECEVVTDLLNKLK